jgi:thioredoxin-related protein
MKTIILILWFLTATINNSQASHPPVMVNSYNDALLLSEQTKIPILLIFVSDPCEPCSRLKNILPDVEDKIICLVELKLKNRSLIQQFKVRSVPDSIVIDHLENQSKRLKGFINKESYLEWINKK